MNDIRKYVTTDIKDTDDYLYNLNEIIHKYSKNNNGLDKHKIRK